MSRGTTSLSSASGGSSGCDGNRLPCAIKKGSVLGTIAILATDQHAIAPPCAQQPSQRRREGKRESLRGCTARTAAGGCRARGRGQAQPPSRGAASFRPRLARAQREGGGAPAREELLLLVLLLDEVSLHRLHEALLEGAGLDSREPVNVLALRQHAAPQRCEQQRSPARGAACKRSCLTSTALVNLSARLLQFHF